MHYYRIRCICVPCGCGGGGEAVEEDLGRRAPKKARLQLARRPLMTRVAESSQAFLAASASLKVTFFHHKNQNINWLIDSQIDSFNQYINDEWIKVVGITILTKP